MKGLDLDALRDRWQGASNALDAELGLDTTVMRVELDRRSARALRRHARRLLVGNGSGGLLLLALGVFLWSERFDALYLLAGASIGTLLLAEWIVNFRQWRAVAAIDYTRPVAEVQSVLARLRSARLRLVKWVVLTAVILWWPGVAVIFKGLFGADLLRGLHWSVFATSIGLGLLLVPLGLWIMALVSRRGGGRPGFERWLDEVAGSSFARARRELEAREDFDAGPGVAIDDDGRPVQTSSLHPIAPEHAAAMGMLKRRLLLVILVYAAGVLLMGAFNGAHGGMARYLVPGLIVHFALLANMVAAIAARAQLPRVEGLFAPSALPGRLTMLARLQARAAQSTAVISPVSLLALVQVLAKALAGTDAFAAVGATTAWALLASATLASLVLGWRWFHRRDAFARRWVNAITFGCTTRFAQAGASDSGVSPVRGEPVEP